MRIFDNSVIKNLIKKQKSSKQFCVFFLNLLQIFFGLFIYCVVKKTLKNVQNHLKFLKLIKTFTSYFRIIDLLARFIRN